MNPKDPSKPSGPVKVGKLTVQVDRDLCIGAATCVAVAPHTFVLDSEAKAIILDTADQQSESDVIDGAKSCPTAAIFVYNENGEKIFPV